MSFKGSFRSTIEMKTFNAYFKKELYKALEIAGANLLNKTVNGSAKVPEKAPVDLGPLRGSASLFLGSKYLESSNFQVSSTRKTTRGPETNIGVANKELDTLVVFNESYADIMHEDSNKGPGPRSSAEGNSNPGNQWLAKHFYGDGQDWIKDVAGNLEAGLK